MACRLPQCLQDCYQSQSIVELTHCCSCQLALLSDWLLNLDQRHHAAAWASCKGLQTIHFDVSKVCKVHRAYASQLHLHLLAFYWANSLGARESGSQVTNEPASTAETRTLRHSESVHITHVASVGLPRGIEGTVQKMTSFECKSSRRTIQEPVQLVLQSKHPLVDCVVLSLLVLAPHCTGHQPTVEAELLSRQPWCSQSARCCCFWQ